MSGFPVTLNALFIVLFLLPGIAFVGGMFSSPRVSRDASNLTAPVTFGIILIVSALAQTIYAAIYWASQCIGKDQGRFCNPLGIQMKEIHLSDILLLLLGSTVFSLIAGFFGWLITRLVETGRIQTQLLHGWAYDYIRNPVGKTAFVLTTIGEKSERLGYEGLLKDLRLAPDGSMKAVTLRNVARFHVAVTKRGVIRIRLKEREAKSWEATELTIEGGRIENFAIKSLSVPFEEIDESGDPVPEHGNRDLILHIAISACVGFVIGYFGLARLLP